MFTNTNIGSAFGTFPKAEREVLCQKLRRFFDDQAENFGVQDKNHMFLSFIQSQPNTLRQQLHTDYDMSNKTSNPKQKLGCSVIGSLTHESKIYGIKESHFDPGAPHLGISEFTIPRSQAVTFAGRFVHAGAEWEGAEKNTRFFLYISRGDIPGNATYNHFGKVTERVLWDAFEASKKRKKNETKKK